MCPPHPRLLNVCVNVLIVVIDFSKKPGGSGCYVYTQTHTNTDTQAHTQITHIESHTRNSPAHPMQTSGDPQAHVPPKLFGVWVRLLSTAQDEGWGRERGGETGNFICTEDMFLIKQEIYGFLRNQVFQKRRCTLKPKILTSELFNILSEPFLPFTKPRNLVPVDFFSFGGLLLSMH